MNDPAHRDIECRKKETGHSDRLVKGQSDELLTGSPLMNELDSSSFAIRLLVSIDEQLAKGD